MSAHAYATMMAQALEEAGGETVEEEDLVRTFFCKAYINSELWAMFSTQLSELRKDMAEEILVEQNSTLVREMEELADSFKEDREKLSKGLAKLPETFIKFLDAQDRFLFYMHLSRCFCHSFSLFFSSG